MEGPAPARFFQLFEGKLLEIFGDTDLFLICHGGLSTDTLGRSEFL